MPLTQWMQELLDFLCKIYRFWFGRSCSEFDGDVPKAIDLVTGTFERDGLPVFPLPRDKDMFKMHVDGLEMCLAEPGNSLDPMQNATLVRFIVDVRKALG